MTEVDALGVPFTTNGTCEKLSTFVSRVSTNVRVSVIWDVASTPKDIK